MVKRKNRSKLSPTIIISFVSLVLSSISISISGASLYLTYFAPSLPNLRILGIDHLGFSPSDDPPTFTCVIENLGKAGAYIDGFNIYEIDDKGNRSPVLLGANPSGRFIIPPGQSVSVVFKFLGTEPFHEGPAEYELAVYAEGLYSNQNRGSDIIYYSFVVNWIDFTSFQPQDVRTQ
jgi:hypothetical protein